MNDFLSIGKIEDGKIEAHFSHFNIQELVTVILNELSGIVKSGQRISYHHLGDKTVLLDPFLLRNVLINLLSNAIKFSGENGRIEVSSERTNSNFTLVIKDNGIGIPEADREHLFERFFRGANATNIQGTGLGLHIVEKYIELMNGQIDFTSDLEKGTSFFINFKISKRSEV